MKNNRKYYWLIALVSLVLGIILSITYKTARTSLSSGQMPNQYAHELQIELKRERENNETLKAKNDELENRLEEYEASVSSSDIYVNTLFENAKLYRSLAGYTDLQGPGITIEITEPKALTDQGVHYGIQADVDVLRAIQSDLNAAGSEAISINDLRITSRTEIVRAGEHIVINGVATNTPIVIKAIGNPDTLYSALHIPNGLVDYIRSLNYNINVVKEKNIIVSKTRQPNTFKYGEVAEEKKE